MKGMRSSRLDPNRIIRSLARNRSTTDRFALFDIDTPARGLRCALFPNFRAVPEHGHAPPFPLAPL